MNGYLKPEEIPLLKLPKDAKELEQVISEAQSENMESSFWINEGAMRIIEKAAKSGNEDSIEMLYALLNSPCARFLENHNITNFFLYASAELMEKKAEGILRHLLIDEPHFKEENRIISLIKSCKRHLNGKVFEKNPEIEDRINAIQEEALNKITMSVETKSLESASKEENVDVTTLITTTAIEITEIHIDEPKISVKEDASDIEGEKEEMQALQKISDGVPLAEKNKGKEMIKFFLSKAKAIKKKIGQIFEGGDNHDDR